MVAFRLGSIPVRVRGWFFLLALFLGANDSNPARLAIWVGIVFVSVMIHELGHALVGKAFGLTPAIELHGMGGTTSWAESEPVSHGRRILISLAGPFAGFAFAALVWGVQRTGIIPPSPLALYALGMLNVVNVFWGIFNLLPMLPLDGGNVMRSVFGAFTKGGGAKAAHVVSMVVAGALGALSLYTKQWWILYLAGLYGVTNFRALRGTPREADKALALAIAQAQGALDRQDGHTAVSLLRAPLGQPTSLELRKMGLRMFAYGLLLDGSWRELLEVLHQEPALIGAGDLAKYADAARGLGRVEDAERIEAIVVSPALGTG